MSDVNAVFFGNCRDRYFTGAGYTPEVLAAELGEGIWDCRIRSVARVSSSQRSAVRRERSMASRQTFMFLAQGLETMLSDAFCDNACRRLFGELWTPSVQQKPNVGACMGILACLCRFCSLPGSLTLTKIQVFPSRMPCCRAKSLSVLLRSNEMHDQICPGKVFEMEIPAWHA